MPGLAAAAEEMGFDGVVVRENRHDPFTLLSLASYATSRVSLGTSVAVAFARSPTLLAYSSWDIQMASSGRFILGIGSQVRAHIERRFGMQWSDPVSRMREVILVLREVWDSWQKRRRPRFDGRYYKISLMTDYFDPGPIENPEIPIYISAVNRKMCSLAGELCNGIHVHPLNSPRYIKEVVLPGIKSGAEKAGRSADAVKLSATVLTATGVDEDEIERGIEDVKMFIAFYGSTPSYRLIFDLYGWGGLAESLTKMAREGRWRDMPRLIDDETLSEFSIIGPPSKIPSMIMQRYRGLLDRLYLHIPFNPHVSWWREITRGFRELRGD